MLLCIRQTQTTLLTSLFVSQSVSQSVCLSLCRLSVQLFGATTRRIDDRQRDMFVSTHGTWDNEISATQKRHTKTYRRSWTRRSDIHGKHTADVIFNIKLGMQSAKQLMRRPQTKGQKPRLYVRDFTMHRNAK